MKSFILILALLILIGAAPSAVGQVMDVEPNNSRASATPFVLDTTLVGQLSADAENPDFEDWYSFTSPGNGSLTVIIHPSEGHIVRLQLWNMLVDWEMVDAYNVSSQPFSLTYPNLKEGRYAIRVSNLLNSSGSYEVTTRFSRPSRPDGEDPEPNDTPQTARLVALNEPFTGHLGYSNNIETDDQDWMMFNVPTDGSLSIHGIPDSTAAIIFQVWREQETYDNTTYFAEEGHGIYVGEEKILNIPNLQAGTYFLRMQSSTRYGSYETTIGFNPANPSNPADIEPNDLITDASTLNPYGIFTGHLGFTNGAVTDYIDTYRFETTVSGDAMFLALPDSSLGLGITLLASDGVTIVATAGHSTFTGQPAQLIVPNLIPGTYYLKFACGVFQQGTYSFHISTADSLIVEPEPILSGRVTNALTGAPIAGATVRIAGLEALTDSLGAYVFAELPAAATQISFTADSTFGAAPFTVRFNSALIEGQHSLTVSATGFAEYVYPGLTISGTTVFDLSLSPVLQDADMRVVLNWAAEPRDLDSHLITPDGFHVYYSSPGSAAEAPFVTLDHDITTGYGPETITLVQRQPGTYRYYIHNYSAETAITSSAAVVQFYDAEGLLMTVEAPTTGDGLYWVVAEIDGLTGRITLINRLQDTSPDQTLTKLPFKVSGTAAITEWAHSWDFGDGGTSTLADPEHTYLRPGIFSVTLTAISGEQTATLTRRDYIHVEADEEPPMVPWTDPYETTYQSPIAELVHRTGDIDNLGFGWPDGFDPFSGNDTPVHPFPFAPELDDPNGTDRIIVVSSYQSGGSDGYTSTSSRPDNNPVPIRLTYDLRGIAIRDVLLQMFVDDFQPVRIGSEYQVLIDGHRVPILEDVINSLDQTGPIGKLITVRLSQEFFEYLADGQFDLFIDDPVSGAGDGFSIDFVRMLINPLDYAHHGSITGTVTNLSGQPIESAMVTAGGYHQATTSATGTFRLDNVPAGLVYLSVDAFGYERESVMIDLISGDTTDVVIQLRPAAEPEYVLSGYVTDALTGEPIAGAFVMVEGSFETMTDSIGFYGFTELMPPTTQMSFNADVTQGVAPLSVTFTPSFREGFYTVRAFADGYDYFMYNDLAADTLMVLDLRLEAMPHDTTAVHKIARMNSIPTGDWHFYWGFGDGGTSEDFAPTHVYTFPGVYSVFAEAIDTIGGRFVHAFREDYILVEADTSVVLPLLTGRVTDAVNGEPIAGATVTVGSLSTSTDSLGLYTFFELPDAPTQVAFNADSTYGELPLTVQFQSWVRDGFHTIRVHADGFDEFAFHSLVVQGPTQFDLSLSPTLDLADMRVVLNWGATPRDLDSHIRTPDGYHIYYSNQGNHSAPPFTTLDHDVLEGYGPETITLVQRRSGTYAYYIHNYSGEAAITTSAAVVRFYDGQGLLMSVEVPVEGTGLYWYVADIDGETGRISLINRIQEVEPGADVAEKAIAKAPVRTAEIDWAYTWDFGDGSGSDLVHPAHTYTQAGVYSVSLSATLGERTARMTRRDYIHVTEPFSAIEAVNDTVTVIAGTIVRIDPMANDVLPDTLDVFMELHDISLNYGMLMMTADQRGLIYASAVNAVGIDSIRYTLHYQDGNVSASILIHVVEGVVRNQSPVVALPVEISILEDSTLVIPMRKLVFDDHDSVAQLDIRVNSVNPAVNVLLSEAKDTLRISALPNWWGTSVLTLTASDRDGGVTTDHVTLTFIPVNDAPVAIFLKQAETLTDDGLVVDFIDQSHDALDPEGAITAWAWDFGDGHTSSLRHPSHTYTRSGTFIVRLNVTDNAGAATTMETTVVSEFTSVEPNERITEFALRGAYPNPFNPTTLLRIDVPEPGDVVIEVFTNMGQRVATRRETLSAGSHNVAIDALGWSSGVYLYTVRYRDQMVSSKMTLIK